MNDDSDIKIKAHSFDREAYCDLHKILLIYNDIYEIIGWSNETDSNDHERRKWIDKNSRQNSLNFRISKLEK